MLIAGTMYGLSPQQLYGQRRHTQCCLLSGWLCIALHLRAQVKQLDLVQMHWCVWLSATNKHVHNKHTGKPTTRVQV